MNAGRKLHRYYGRYRTSARMIVKAGYNSWAFRPRVNHRRTKMIIGCQASVLAAIGSKEEQIVTHGRNRQAFPLPCRRLRSLSAIAIDVRKAVSAATNMTTIKITAIPAATRRRATPIETAGRYVILIVRSERDTESSGLHRFRSETHGGISAATRTTQDGRESRRSSRRSRGLKRRLRVFGNTRNREIGKLGTQRSRALIS